MIYIIESYKNKKLSKIYNNSIQKLDSFFGIKWIRNKPEIFIIKNKEDINKMNPKPPYKIKGWVKNNNIFLLEKKAWEKEHKKLNPNYYKENILHEMTHSYFLQLSNKNKKPDWLWEGIANYISGTYMKNSIEKFQTFLNHFEKKDKEVYQESGFVVKLLIEKCGKEKILKLIKTLKKNESENSFKKTFEKIYKFKLNYKNLNNFTP